MTGVQEQRVGLVAGATGVTGRNLLIAMEKSGMWNGLYGVSRRPLDCGGQVKHLPLDMTDKEAMLKGLEGATDVTHLYFCAFQNTGGFTSDVDVNHGMFKRLTEAAEAAGCRLQHVHFISGTKWYGPHLGPIKTPAKEDDPRAMAPNFYYDMEDYCIARHAAGAQWGWSSVRPNPVCGFSTGSAMNITMTIAVYACLCKELGLPFRFPGSEAAYNALLEVVDVELLSEAVEWISTHPTAGNTSYNVSNGDIFRWSEVWPKLAAYFDMPLAKPQRFSMTTMMGEHEAVWDALVKKHGLKPIPYKDVATWGFGDWVFGQETDWFANVQKLRRAGFQGMVVDTEEMFVKQFDQLRADKVIP